MPSRFEKHYQAYTYKSLFDLIIWVFPRTGYVINTALKGNSY